MPTLDADSVDAVVTDPPYGLKFMGKGLRAFSRLLRWSERSARETRKDRP
jgi:DNA modification methylase